MSPKSRGRRNPKQPTDKRRAQQREDRQQRRREYLQQLRDREDFQELRDSMRGAPRELRSFTRPVTVEAYTSTLINGWRHSLPPDVAKEDTERFLVDLAMSHATEPGIREAVARIYARETVALLHAVASVSESGPAQHAKESLSDPDLPSVEAPEWTATVGQSQLQECVVAEHELGDETEVFFTYRYTDEAPHGLRVKVNHNLAGMATDVRAEADGAEALKALRTDAESDPRRTINDGDPAVLRAVLTDAFAVTAQADDPPVTDGYRNLHTLALARLRGLPEGGQRPEPPEWSELGRSDLVSDFVTSPEAQGLAPEAAEAIAAELVGYGVEHDRGQPLRVSPTKLQVFLLGWLPRTGLLPAQHVDHVPDVVPAWVRYAARRTGLSETSLDETLTALPAITGRFKAAYEDPERWSPERAAVERLLADVEPTAADVDDVFARRMFALPRLPDPDFDPTDEEAFAELIREEHPGADELAQDAGGGHQLTIALHTALARQLWSDDPPETWSTAQRLLDQGFERQEVLQALAFALSTQMQRTPQNGSPFDKDAYRAALDTLPDSWPDRT